METQETTQKSNKPGTIKCENCGSSSVVVKSNDLAICEYCGSKIKIKHNVTNNINVTVDQYGTKTSSENVVLKTNLSEDEFFRQALIEMTKQDDVPVTFLDCEFGEITIEYPQFLMMKIRYQGTYSASIGYDRKERYEDYETHYDSQLKMNVRQKVIKERTVTDWQPYYGNASSVEFVCVQTNGDDKATRYVEDIVENSELNSISVGYEESDLQNIEIKKATMEQMDSAIMIGKYYADSRIHLPGDHMKDYRSSFSHEIVETKYCIAPQYSMTIKDKDSQAQLKSFVTKMGLRGTVPSDAKDDSDAISTSSSKYGKISIALSVVAMVLMLAFTFIPISISYKFIVLLVCILMTTIGYKVFLSKKKKITKNFYNDKLDAKIERLKEYLENHNMPALTQEELDYINKSKR